ncbi:MAG: acetyl-CoA carboxylase biotin carboxylase subunit, partial [Pseudomonadota bacterium]
MRVVHEESRFVPDLEAAQREALAAFNDGAVYLEKFITNPRHVEVQVMADQSNNAVHLYERDCSVQRRHQKVIEETPCPVLQEDTRQKMGEVAVRATRAVDYRGAGTVEFLYNPKANEFYFLEMNTRLQVEHPITELCTGVDLVRWQILVADGKKLPLTQEQIQPRGAAIECRIYAEDPVKFLPSPGKITVLRQPSGPGVRDDSGVYSGATITPFYDPLISKLCVWARDRNDAVARMKRALSEYRVVGIQTNLLFHELVLEHPAFVSGEYDTGFIAAHKEQLTPPKTTPDILTIAAAAIDNLRHSSRQAEIISSEANGISAWRRVGRQ